MLLVVALSLVPMTQMKFDMFGGGEAGELQVFYQWKGSYTLGQLSEEVARVEGYLDANREEFRITQVYSWFGEQGGSGTMITLDPSVRDSNRSPNDQRRPADLGARGPRHQGSGDRGGGMGQNAQVRLVGDMEALRALAADVVPILARRPELRDVRLDAGDRLDSWPCGSTRRAAAFGFSADQVASFVSLALRGSQLRSISAARTRSQCGCASRAESFDASDIATFMVRAPTGAQCHDVDGGHRHQPA